MHLLRAATALFLISGLLQVSAGGADAAQPGPVPVLCNPFGGGTCLVVVSNPGAPGTAENVSRAARRGGATAAVAPPSRLDLCSYSVEVPEPPASDPVWQGRSTTAGTIYIKACPITKSGPTTQLIFVARGAAPPPSVTAAELAQQALAELTLPKPAIERSPSPVNRNGQGVPFTWVNLWTWFWTSPATWVDVSKQATAGPIWARVTVSPQRLTFAPGDGASAVSCNGPGRPWTTADGSTAPAEIGGCGYRYISVMSGSPLTTTVSIQWSVSWTGVGGTGGQLPDMTTSVTAPLSVEQIQSVNVLGSR